jgi:hypothetical protein
MQQAAAKKQEEMFEDDLDDQTWAKISTLKGDVRDSILEWYKRKEKAWGSQSGFDQKATIYEIEAFADRIIRKVALLVATRGFDSIPVTISEAGLHVEKGIVAKIMIARTKENVVDINDCLGKAIQLVPLGLTEFMGERAPAKPDVIPGDLRLPDPEAVVADARTTPATPPHDPETGEIRQEQPPAGPHDPETGEVKEAPPAHG